MYIVLSEAAGYRGGSWNVKEITTNANSPGLHLSFCKEKMCPTQFVNCILNRSEVYQNIIIKIQSYISQSTFHISSTKARLFFCCYLQH